MHEFLQRDLEYVIRLDEVIWGCVLLAVTLVIHGGGLFYTMRGALVLTAGGKKKLGAGVGVGVVVLVALVMVILSLIEVSVWAGFFTWKQAQPNVFTAFYNALVNYTTLGAGYLPLRWRLLEGMLGMAGLLSFAFTTSLLMTVAHGLVWPALVEQQRQAQRSGEPPRT